MLPLIEHKDFKTVSEDIFKAHIQRHHTVTTAQRLSYNYSSPLHKEDRVDYLLSSTETHPATDYLYFLKKTEN